MVKCPLCGVPNATLTLEALDANRSSTLESFKIFTCQSCRLGFTDPSAQQFSPEKAYPSGYRPHQRLSAPWYSQHPVWMSAKGRADRSLEYYSFTDPHLVRPEMIQSAPGFVWEIGCGVGDLLSQFAIRGWQVLGVEQSTEAVSIARQRGMSVVDDTFEHVAMPGRRVDAVIFNHSFEHIADPNRSLDKAMEALRPGGTLIIAVPNFDSPGRRFFGNAWVHLDVPRHFYHFSPETIQRLLLNRGFRVDRIYFDDSLEPVVASMRNMVRIKRWRDVQNKGDFGPNSGSAIARLESMFSRLSVMSGLSVLLYPLLFFTRSHLRSAMVVVSRRS